MALKTDNHKNKKEILEKVRNLSDKDLWEIVKLFDLCSYCWHDKPEKCEYRPIRKKLGMGECNVYKDKRELYINEGDDE